MIKHIVFIRINDSSEDFKKIAIDKLAAMLTLLPASITEISQLEVGRNFSSRPTAFDLSLSVEFENEDNLKKYQIHPNHVKVLEYMRSLDLETAVVDYIY